MDGLEQGAFAIILEELCFSIIGAELLAGKRSESEPKRFSALSPKLFRMSNLQPCFLPPLLLTKSSSFDLFGIGFENERSLFLSYIEEPSNGDLDLTILFDFYELPEIA